MVQVTLSQTVSKATRTRPTVGSNSEGEIMLNVCVIGEVNGVGNSLSEAVSKATRTRSLLGSTSKGKQSFVCVCVCVCACMCVCVCVCV